ncbi:MAG: hypothetical protein JRI30_04840 [Deltaproteobacteria bacterium]|nr:hypothetical protein [Deltaproteobacteria bacterium]
MKSNSDSIREGISHHFTKRRIIGIVGSPRKNGNSDVLLNHTLGEALHNINANQAVVKKSGGLP